MQRNVARRNILCWRDPQPQAFQFRNVSFEHNHSDSNLVWHFGQPLKTGQFKLKAVTGPNIAPPNADFEQGTPGKMPDRWSWHIRPSPATKRRSHTTRRTAGVAACGSAGQPDPANQDKESWARIPSVKSVEVPVHPARSIACTAWLRADRPNTRVEIGLQAYRRQPLHLAIGADRRVGTDWAQHELIARFPAQPPEMKSLYVRVRLPDGDGAVCVDDVELHAAEAMDEWSAWQALGMDRHSRVADPLLRRPGKRRLSAPPGLARVPARLPADPGREDRLSPRFDDHRIMVTESSWPMIL